jgi:hypothetical protein
MGLNRRSIALIERSKELLASKIDTSVILPVEDAKRLIREEGLARYVKDVTINRIGEQGRGEGLYGYDGNRFWSLTKDTDLNARPLNQFVQEWAEDTVHEVDVRVAISRVNGALAFLAQLGQEVTTNSDVTKLAQIMNSNVDPSNVSMWNRLGSFRSFAKWGIEMDMFEGDTSRLWPCDGLEETVTVGTHRARIAPGSMTNTDNQWMYHVTDQNGVLRQIVWAHEDEIEDALRYLASVEYNEDNNVNLEDLMDPESIASLLDTSDEVVPVLQMRDTDGDGDTEPAIAPGLRNNPAADVPGYQDDFTGQITGGMFARSGRTIGNMTHLGNPDGEVERAIIDDGLPRFAFDEDTVRTAMEVQGEDGDSQGDEDVFADECDVPEEAIKAITEAGSEYKAAQAALNPQTNAVALARLTVHLETLLTEVEAVDRAQAAVKARIAEINTIIGDLG